MSSAAHLTAELMQLPSLSGLSHPSAGTLLAGSTERTLQSGRELFSEGAPSQHLYVVLEGQLKVTCATDDGQTQVVVGQAQQGAILGEMGLLGGTARSASVRADTACRLLEIPGGHLEALIEEGHPAAWILLRAMQTQLVERLRTVDERVDAVLEPPVPERNSTRLRSDINALWKSSGEG